MKHHLFLYTASLLLGLFGLQGMACAKPLLKVTGTNKDTTLTFALSQTASSQQCEYILYGSQKRKKVAGKKPRQSAVLHSWTTVSTISGDVTYQVSNITSLRGKQKRRKLFFRISEECSGTKLFSSIRRLLVRTSPKKKKTLVLKSFLSMLSERLPNSDIRIQEAFPNLTFTLPVDIRNAGDGSNRLFVVEQGGLIKVFENSSSVAEADAFLDLTTKTNIVVERGLFSIAFHPNFSSNGYVYVHYTDLDGDTVIERYTVSDSDANTVNPSTAKTILTINQPSSFHNGGSILFGSDGYLYITSGDGGPQVDPNGNGQNRQTLLGSILRIDIDTESEPYLIPQDNPFVGNSDGFREEIFAYGLRNPWRASFDRILGDLWVGDVGQTSFEEINIIKNGENYGWVILEGNTCIIEGCNTTGLNLTPPLYTYSHEIGFSITGGYVYRGNKLFSLYGKYLFGDFVNGKIFIFNSDKNTAEELTDTENFITTFGEDEDGELYYATFSEGKIYKLTPR